ncbi:34494_t:CDS:1, partial [Gigaspora margarita]
VSSEHIVIDSGASIKTFISRQSALSSGAGNCPIWSISSWHWPVSIIDSVCCDTIVGSVGNRIRLGAWLDMVCLDFTGADYIISNTNRSIPISPLFVFKMGGRADITGFNAHLDN